MATKKISQYTPITSSKKTDLVDISVDIGGGNFETRSITIGDLKKPTYDTIAYSVAPDFDVDEVEVYEMPLTGDATPTLSNTKLGGVYIIILASDGVGGHAVNAAAFGTKDNSSVDVDSSEINTLYVYTVVVRPGGLKFYTINTVTL